MATHPALVRRLAAALTFGAAAIALSLLPATAASAHDELLSSSPASGEVLTQSPTALVLTFSEAPLETGNAAELRDHTGALVALDAPVVDGSTVRIGVPAALTGDYRLTWRVVSGDGHTVSGTIDFGVGAGATGKYAGPSGAGSDGGSDGADQNWYGVPRPVMIGVFSIFVIGTVVMIIFWVRQLRRGTGN
ncbi:MAG TPA: copper resistance CopC family protein [Candidatus Lumbricidophila sp.]|nr:copper resistance CopC family protein [Candidatus Lumbricidophila sp.]